MMRETTLEIGRRDRRHRRARGREVARTGAPDDGGTQQKCPVICGKPHVLLLSGSRNIERFAARPIAELTEAFQLLR